MRTCAALGPDATGDRDAPRAAALRRMAAVLAARRPAARAASAVPDILGPEPGRRLLRDQPRLGLGGGEGALRQPAERLLAAAGTRASLEAVRARPSNSRCCAGHRSDERRPADDARLGRPAAPADFAGAAERLEDWHAICGPGAVAFVGKEAYRGPSPSGPSSGGSGGRSATCGLFVLPSTSPANAAVPWANGCAGSVSCRAWLEPVERSAVRALVLDRDERVLLVEFRDEQGQTWWATTGGGVDSGETAEAALRRELNEEAGLLDFELGPQIWWREHTFAWAGRIWHQAEQIFLVRIDHHEPAPIADLAAEHVSQVRWWTLGELEATTETLGPEAAGLLPDGSYSSRARRRSRSTPGCDDSCAKSRSEPWPRARPRPATLTAREAGYGPHPLRVGYGLTPARSPRSGPLRAERSNKPTLYRASGW